VKESIIDDKVLRLIRTELRYGLPLARSSIQPIPPTQLPDAPSP